jgi:hypothetical protein
MATTGSLRYSKNFGSDLYSTGYRSGHINSRRDNKDLYNSYNSNSYNFKERAGRLRWKEIVGLDIESMIRNNDLGPLDTYLDNMIFSTIDESDLQIVPEHSIVKIFKTFQYLLEHFLSNQIKLENENKHLETSYNQLLQDSSSRENILKENKNLIRALKKEKKEKDMVLTTYKNVIDEYKLKPEKNYFFCRYCSGKKFSSEAALYEHNVRRHGDNNLGKSTHRVNIDDKIDQMKNQFETYIKSFKNESYMKIFENQKHLETKLMELKSEKKNEIVEIENNFKNTIMDLKEMIKTSQIGMVYQPTQKENKESSNKQYEETMNILKSQAKQMNDILLDMQRAQNEKIQSVAEQLVSFKKNISEEFGNLKQEKLKKKEKKDKKYESDDEKKSRSKEKEEVKKEEKKIVTGSIDHAGSIEIVNPEKPKKVISKKSLFNAGPIESDHSEEEIKNTRKQSTPRRKASTINKTATFKKIESTDNFTPHETKPNEFSDVKIESHDSPFMTKISPTNTEPLQPPKQSLTKNSLTPPVVENKNNFFTSQESIKIENIEPTSSEPPKISDKVKVGKREVSRKLEEMAILFDNYALRDYDYYNGKISYTTKM